MPKRPRYFYSPMDEVKRWGFAAALLAGFVVLYTIGTFAGIIQS